MLISSALRLIIMMPWKCASSTLHATLEPYNDSRYDRFFNFNPVLQRVTHQHLTLADAMMLPESKLGFRIATFVRNPYDRAYSGFLQLQRDFRDQPQLTFQTEWIGELVRQQIADNMELIIRAGFDFDNWLQLLPECCVLDIGRNTNMPLHPANYWTHLDGKQVAGFIGKVENFPFDFRRLCQFAGIDEPHTRSQNVTSGEVFDHEYKYASRMSKYSRSRINALFKEYFELFEYRMLD
ncbi:sulfotransferase family 2 domain-containing protein [Novosphingobium sp. FKTRR1]|uniref:sulfotransferase family 2 domain-containing protein n=1 Tax=Novosphingobium sp. FKTRR1 TaxID=2879118 RepID=UPI001CF034B0|nr:sulfotransferase family 2 domain-containing protein [Novosphingobium sp. FKTRR1]